jgi:hypothetical protein
MAARGVTPAQTERSGVSRRHDAGSHSVDRIVGLILVYSVFEISRMALCGDPRPLEP